MNLMDKTNFPAVDLLEDELEGLFLLWSLVVNGFVLLDAIANHVITVQC